ncbi:MAG: TIM barrel protein [Candidatus Aminicenantes bacterium]|jgi:sugar phosphate isomerase/epimerase
MNGLKVGIDNYGLFPLELNAFQILDWARSNGAEGVQFSGLTQEESREIDSATLEDISQFASAHNLYLEWGGGQHIPFDMRTWAMKDIFEGNKKAAREAETLGTRIVRSCSGGLMRWNPENPKTETLLEETASALRSQKQMLEDHNVILALETHFEFTTFELLRLFEMCEAEPGEYLGICLDTMNLLTMLEEPLSATERILPWVVSTHIKDGGVIVESDDLISFPAEIGKGVIDLKKIVGVLGSLPDPVNLSIEDHGGSFRLPVSKPEFRAEFPDLTQDEFDKLLGLANLTKDKMEREGLAIVEREQWPIICEERLRQDLSALQKLVSQ